MSGVVFWIELYQRTFGDWFFTRGNWIQGPRDRETANNLKRRWSPFMLSTGTTPPYKPQPFCSAYRTISQTAAHYHIAGFIPPPLKEIVVLIIHITSRKFSCRPCVAASTEIMIFGKKESMSRVLCHSCRWFSVIGGPYITGFCINGASMITS